MKVYIMRKTLDWFEVTAPEGTAMDAAVDTVKEMLQAGDERIFPLNHRHHGVTDFYLNEADLKVQILVSRLLDLTTVDQTIVEELTNLIYDPDFLKHSPYQPRLMTNGDVSQEEYERDSKLIQLLNDAAYDAVYSMLVNENVPESIVAQYREELGLTP